LLPDFDGTRAARERDYRARSLVDGLKAFRAAREANVALLSGVPDEAWSRSSARPQSVPHSPVIEVLTGDEVSDPDFDESPFRASPL